jgi:CBS domain-containing protein
MYAADVVETLPTARPDDDVLSAVRLVAEHGLPGLVIADERGDVVGCVSSVDLLGMSLPRYLWEGPSIARVLDEEHADRIAAAMAGTRVRDLMGEVTDRVPVARPQATVAELAALMVRRRWPLVVVEREGGGTLGIVTIGRLLRLLAAAVEEAP